MPLPNLKDNRITKQKSLMGVASLLPTLVIFGLFSQHQAKGWNRLQPYFLKMYYGVATI